MKMQKLLTFLSLIMVMVLVLAACGGGAKEETTATTEKASEATEEKADTTTEEKAETKSEDPVTITIGSSQNWVKDIDRELAKEFTEETGILVDIQVMPDDQYINVMKSRLLTGEGTDIFLMKSGVAIAEWLPEENCLDLSGEEWVSRTKSWAIDGATYGGRLVGQNMWSVDGWGFLYNPTIFADLGLEVPTTTEEFMAVCEAIQASGTLPIWENGKDGWHLQIWAQQMGAYLRAQNPGLYEGLNDNSMKYVDVPELVQFFLQT